MAAAALIEELIGLVVAGRSSGEGSDSSNSDHIVQKARAAFSNPEELRPFHVGVLVGHAACATECLRAIPVEVWSFSLAAAPPATAPLPLPALFLKNAVRSHLHFSTLSAWLARAKEQAESGESIAYSCRAVDSDVLSTPDASDAIERHIFPLGLAESSDGLLRCGRVAVAYVKRDLPVRPSGVCPLQLGPLPSDEWLLPSPLSSPDPRQENSDRIAEELHEEGTHLIQDVLSFSKGDEYNSQRFSRSGVKSKSPALAVISPSDEKDERRTGETRSPDDFIEDGVKAFKAEFEDEEKREGKRVREPRSLEFVQRPRRLQLSGEERPQFNKRTGLPLSSSPAPSRTPRHSLASSPILRVPKQRSSLSESDASSRSARRGAVASRSSAPLLGSFEESALHERLSTGTELDGFTLQIAASGPSLLSPHITLPLKTSTLLEDVTHSDSESSPLPFLSVASLGGITGRKGYRIPKKGLIQATLFNPEKAVVRVFVVLYDLTDMPAGQTTFIRQRCRLSPETPTDNFKHPRYVIHFRVRSDRTGRLFLHTDVRLLFSYDSTADALNIEMRKSPRGTESAVDSGRFQLLSETEIPSLPRFSPTK